MNFQVLLTASVTYRIYNESGIEVPFDKEKLICIIRNIETYENCRYQDIEVVFVGDEQIRQWNQIWLGHDYVTDIITFPYHENSSLPEGTLCCCATQILRQSEEYHTGFETELLRVIIHGLLHLAGYDDRTEMQRRKMHLLENKYITTLYNNRS